jgi:RNA polymerase sigma-70 factor, ECF subfamily
MLAARAGDRASMRTIYEAEAPRLLRRLRHLTGDLAWAQDLAHDVFVVAFAGQASFAGDASVGTWLYGIARNLWRNARRKSQRRAKLLLAAPWTSASGLAGEASEGARLGELERRLDVALAELSEPLREAFVLRVIEQLPLSEAAALAGVAESTISKRARKAEDRVRAAFDESEPTTQEPRP